MNRTELVEHKNELSARLQVIEQEKVLLLRKLKALDILLEDGVGLAEVTAVQRITSGQVAALDHAHSRGIAKHTVRYSPRISLIGAVEKVAKKQSGPFTSVELLTAMQRDYPEFKLSETKHISSPLSDLVERGVLVLERKKQGALPNLYRAA